MGLSTDNDPTKAGICTRTGKAMYSRSSAKSTAKRLQQKTKDNITAYRCPHCMKWHVGTKRKFV